MQKKAFGKLCLVLALTSMCTWGLGSCASRDDETNNPPKTEQTTEFTIQYTDEAGTHQLNVTAGMPYSLEAVPFRYGYEFLGLFDAEVGGTQYVNATGASVSPFTDNKNIVLFPQWKAKEYTVVLDYQGAENVGVRSLTVAYNASLPELPKNLAAEHKDFVGWYTEPNCKGEQIADEYGLLPTKAKLTETIYDLDDEDGYVYLYAGFEWETFKVTFNFDAGMAPKLIDVAYNTPISQVVPETRKDGNAVLIWSTHQNDTEMAYVFTGNVTQAMTLYAVEWAPVIDFDENGGDEVVPVVARAGETVSLPTPTKELAKFMHWETLSGTKYTATKMPSTSTKLKAVWQAKLVFDENGGSDVDDISESAGAKVTLPTPEKEGYIFAGWYTKDKEKYESTSMPTAGVALKAAWYKAKSEVVTVISATDYNRDFNRSSPSTSDLCYTFDFSNYFSDNQYMFVSIDFHVNLRTSSSSAVNAYVDFYSKKEISSAYLISTQKLSNITNSYRECTFNETFRVNDDFYICFYQAGAGGNYFYLQDFYYTVYYPDTTYLYY